MGLLNCFIRLVVHFFFVVIVVSLVSESFCFFLFFVCVHVCVASVMIVLVVV